MGVISAAVRAAEHSHAQHKPAEQQRPKKKIPKRPPPPTSPPLDIQDMPESYALDDGDEFVKRTLYCSKEQRTAIVLGCAVSHVVDAFTTVPFFLASAQVEQAGKTTVLHEFMLMGAGGWLSRPTSFAVTSKFAEAHMQGKRVLWGLDEVSKTFGESGLGGRQNPIYDMLTERYMWTATHSISVNRVSTDVSSYGMTVMSGIGTSCPKDLRSRCIIIEMQPRPARVRLESILSPSVRTEGKAAGEVLGRWARARQEKISDIFFNGLRRIHPKLVDRREQIWGPLFAVALAAGGDWYQRCMESFLALALNADDRPALTLRQQILLDSAAYLEQENRDRVLSADLLAHLRQLPDRPAYDRRALVNERFLRLLTESLGESVQMRDGSRAGKGRWAGPILEAAAALRAVAYACEEDEDQVDEVEEELAVTENVSPVAGNDPVSPVSPPG
jgi:hypothetical protein